MKVCELWWDHEFGPCEGKIDYHHVWVYAGIQINEIFAILAVCRKHHDMVKTERKVREALERRSLEIATNEELARYPNKDWDQLRNYLNSKK